MSDYRERCNEAKAKRSGIVDQRAQPNRSKRAKPVVVEYRLGEHAKKHFAGNFWSELQMGDWSKWHSYRTTEEAQKAIDNDIRKNDGLWEFRIKPD